MITETGRDKEEDLGPLHAEREAALERSEHTPANELFNYNIVNGDLRIHLQVATDMSLPKKKKYLDDALERIANIVREDESIKQVSMTSSIVFKHKPIIEKIVGFKMDTSWKTKLRLFLKRLLQLRRRRLARAYLDRDEFLSQHPKKPNEEVVSAEEE